MKKSVAIALLLLAGCASPAPQPLPEGEPLLPPMPPMPPVPKVQQQALQSPRAAGTAPARLVVGAGPVTVPTWVFAEGIDGTYQLDASANLTDWWPVAVVYHVTNVTVTSDTVAKRPVLFYRLRPKE